MATGMIPTTINVTPNKITVSAIDPLYNMKICPSIYFFNSVKRKGDSIKISFDYDTTDGMKKKFVVVMHAGAIDRFKQVIDSMTPPGAGTGIDLYFYYPRISPKKDGEKPIPSEMWICNLAGVNENTIGNVELIINWTKHGLEREAAMEGIKNFTNCAEMQKFKSVIENIENMKKSRGNTMIDKALSEMMNKFYPDFSIDTFDPISFAIKIIGYTESGNYLIEDNKLDYKVVMEMDRSLVERIITEMTSLK
jgi:hypothetical protein